MQVELLSITSDAEKIIEKAGRICYASEDKITEDSYIRFIKNLIKNGHTSVLEHASATFKISEISRVCSHQLVRHRLASYSQKSQRYIKEDSFDFVIPPSIKELDLKDNLEYGSNNSNRTTIYYGIMWQIQEIYNRLIEYGIPKEDARFILPNACTTEIVMTMNFRQWRHFLKTRLDKHAQWEIRDLAKNILQILKKNSPIVFEDLI